MMRVPRCWMCVGALEEPDTERSPEQTINAAWPQGGE